MELLKRMILTEGVATGTDIVKVDKFLNHQVNPFILKEIGIEMRNRFKDEQITKILTCEASGIAIAAFVALEFGVDFVFAKKYNGTNLSDEVFEERVYSHTKQKEFNFRVSNKYLNEKDRVLIVDDFLASGNALEGLIKLVEKADAKVVGCGIVIEKTFQGGGEKIRAKGYRVESLAKVKSIDESVIEFC